MRTLDSHLTRKIALRRLYARRSCSRDQVRKYHFISSHHSHLHVLTHVAKVLRHPVFCPLARLEHRPCISRRICPSQVVAFKSIGGWYFCSKRSVLDGIYQAPRQRSLQPRSS